MDTFITPTAAAMPQYGLLRLTALTKLLRRHLWLIVLLAICGGVGGFLYARTLPKSFTASSALTVEGNQFAIPELQGALRSDNAPDPMPWVRTEVQALTARQIVVQVVHHLGLDKVQEFNPALQAPTFIDQIKSAIGPLLPNKSKLSEPTDPDGPVVASVTKALDVFQDNRSLVITVFFTAKDPNLAAKVVNNLIETYVQTRAKRRVAANKGANTAITERIDQVRDDLNRIEAQMKDLRSKSEIVGLRAGSVGQQQLEELTTAAARATIERSQLEVNYERAIAAAKQGSSDALAAVLNSPTVSRLRDQEQAASRRVAELSSRYGPGYPGIQSANAELSSARRGVREEADRIVSSLGAQLRVAREQEADVKRQLDVARTTGVKAENVRAQLDQLQQEATTRRNLYQTLLERAQQTVVQPLGSETPDVRILSAAVPPGMPSGPNMKLAGLMGGIGGALIGCLLSLTRLKSANGFDSAAEVTAATGFPVIATFQPGLLKKGRGLLARAPVDGEDAEALRTLRSRLRFAGRGLAPRTVVFVPAVKSEKAALLAAGLARAAARHGERVLLIGTDVANPQLNALLGQETSMSGNLLKALSGEDWHATIAEDRQPGLDLLVAGRADANAVSLLQRPEFQNLLVEAREEYDLIVLDAAAAASADAISIVEKVDVAVLLVEGKLIHQAVHDAVTRLASAHRTPTVAVLMSRS